MFSENKEWGESNKICIYLVACLILINDIYEWDVNVNNDKIGCQ